MKTNELKKGARIQLRCGWYATLIDNARGNIRLADVEGFCREMGSIYSHDIAAYYSETDGHWHSDIEYTPAQMKCKAFANSL